MPTKVYLLLTLEISSFPFRLVDSHWIHSGKVIKVMRHCSTKVAKRIVIDTMCDITFLIYMTQCRQTTLLLNQKVKG